MDQKNEQALDDGKILCSASNGRIAIKQENHRRMEKSSSLSEGSGAGFDVIAKRK
ncbi:MAG: hypothetical protein ABFC57_18160 [Veillonellales bacterium]